MVLMNASWIKMRNRIDFTAGEADILSRFGEVGMKAKPFLVLGVFLLLAQTGLEGMPIIPSTAQTASPSIAMTYYLAKAIVRTTDGRVHYGLLAGLENDCLNLKKGPSEEKFSYRDISEVTIESGGKTGTLMATGMLLGIYLGNVLFSRADGQPIAYMDQDTYSEAGYLLLDVVYASVGIGLGYLAALLRKNEAVFRFGEGESDRLAEWERLKGFLAGRRGKSRFHLSIQGGRVFTPVSDCYQETFSNAHYYTSTGFQVVSPGYQDYRYVEAARHLNLLRRAALTVPLRPKIEVGAAVVFAGEPGVGGTSYGNMGYRNVWQTYNAVGCYAVAVYKPLLRALPEKVQWRIGLGAGAARVDFEMGMYAQGGYPDYEEEWAKYKTSQTAASGLVFTELGYSIGPHISLGLAADYVFGPTQEIPAFPGWGIPGQKIRLGNGCVGLTMGMHF
jgi:hypothetical protein